MNTDITVKKICGVFHQRVECNYCGELFWIQDPDPTSFICATCATDANRRDPQRSTVFVNFLRSRIHGKTKNQAKKTSASTE